MVIRDSNMNLIQRIEAKYKRIAIVGDAIVDRWIHGSVTFCQDHCQKFVTSREYVSPGGAANAKNCLSNWYISTQLHAQTLFYRSIKTRYMVDDTIIFRIDDDMRKEVGDISILEKTKFVDSVLICDYDKGFLTEELIQSIIKQCKLLQIPCVVDAKRHPNLYKGAIIKCNEDYFRKYGGTPEVITQGDKPPIVLNLAIDHGGSNVKCINHVGAGDCFAAHLILALTYDFSLHEAATIAHSAGRVYVQHKHNRPPKPEEIFNDS
jgi:bifunctional ADP-heptose synthase (sugar kinase/adenylyltransferase)